QLDVHTHTPNHFPYTTLFRSGAAQESLAHAFELGSQLDIVVDLTVVGDPTGALGIAHGLVAGRAEIEDREPTVHEPDPESHLDRSEEHTSELQSRVDLVCCLP